MADTIMSQPPKCGDNDPECECPPLNQGDPFNVASGLSFLRREDLRIDMAVGSFSLYRVFSGSDALWSEIPGAGISNAPPPFGVSRTNSTSLNWWHSLFSSATLVTRTQASPLVLVRDPGGRLESFTASTCDGGVAGWACSGPGDEAERDRLLLSTPDAGAGYTLFTDEGRKLIFNVPWRGAATDSKKFLGAIWNSRDEEIAKIEYSMPNIAGVTCPNYGSGCDGGSECNSGAPYVSAVTLSNGTKLQFLYRALIGANGMECVLDYVTATGLDAGTATVASYSYDGDKPGQLAGFTAGPTAASSDETYGYTGGFTVSGPKGTVTHTYTGGQVTVSDEPNHHLLVSGWGTNGGTQVTNSAVYGPYGASAPVSSTFQTGTATGNLSARVSSVTEDCATGSQICVTGTTAYLFDVTTSSIWYEKGTTDKAGHGTVAIQTASTSPFRQLTEKTLVQRTDRVAGIIEQERYSYDYKASQQVVKTHSRASNYTGQADVADTNTYDDLGRVTSVIKTGQTRTWGDATNLAGAIVPQSVGTFTFYYAKDCVVGGANEAVVEVHGPCVAAGTDCAGTDYPVTQQIYWSSQAPNSKRGQLKQVLRYPSSGCTGVLTQSYDNYDGFGNLLSETDPNGVTTTYTWDGPRHKMLTRTVGGNTTSYGYDRDELAWIRHPRGNYEVFCHHQGGPGCPAAGAWSPQLLWKAKAGDSTGTNWSEKIAYDYWPGTGNVETESYLSCSSTSCGTAGAGELRKVKRFAADSAHNPIREGLGTPNTTGNRSPVEWVRKYGHADELLALGQPYNNAADTAPNCENGSTKCSTMAYDAAERLTSVTEYPSATSTTPTKTCFWYDNLGNVKDVIATCETTADCPVDPGSSACASRRQSYEYDDFGNLVRVTLPNTGNGTTAGIQRFLYDAAGHVVQEDDEAVRAAPNWYYMHTYDRMGRKTSSALVTGTSSVLTSAWSFDSRDLDAVGSCEALGNTQGRLRSKHDSFGWTWYSYDAEGRVVKESRLRAGATCGSTNIDDKPSTSYVYDANGNLYGIVYPHGRLVYYGFPGNTDTWGRQDRVSYVMATRWTNTLSWTWVPLLQNVAWEPYGGLRAYEAISPNNSNNVAAVEYLLGDKASTVPTLAACSAMGRPVDSWDWTNSDQSGLLRGIWVSHGALSTSPSGDVLKRKYAWQGDQISTQDSCFIWDNTVLPRRESFTYDQRMRLTRATGSGSGYLNASRSYGYSGSGMNRQSETIDGETTSYVYGTGAPFQDQLQWKRRNHTLPATSPNATWDYSGTAPNGEQGRIQYENDSSGSPTYSIEFRILTRGTASPYTVAPASVFRAARIANGGFFDYFYDAEGRRRLKSYPTGISDEYFYDLGHNLLEDRGNPSVTAGAEFSLDEYIWLDNRPVAVLRSQMSYVGSPGGAWRRVIEDWNGGAVCTRNAGAGSPLSGETSVCGPHFIVTDHLPKPILMLDGQLRMEGAADYDPFGYVNRQATPVETPHPYVDNANYTYPLCNPRLGGNEAAQTRARFHMIDLEGGWDYLYLETLGGARLATYTGQHLTPTNPTSPWLAVPTADKGQLNAHATSDYSITYQGVSFDSCEYRRYDARSVTKPTWIPLRFPGQYYDEETDLFENWHRYYDPGKGGYLSVEPMLSKSSRPRAAFAYAKDNPVSFFDDNGWKVKAGTGCSDRVHKLLANMEQAIRAKKADCECMRLLTKFKVKQAFLESKLFEVLCRPQGDIAKDHSSADACGYGGRGDAKVEVASDGKNCDPAAELVAHELGHESGELRHEPNSDACGGFGDNCPKLMAFRAMQKCFAPDGSLRDSPKRGDIFDE